MGLPRLIAAALSACSLFSSATSGNITITAGLLAVPLVSGVGVAVDTSRAVSTRTAIQVGLDSTALSLVPQASSLSNADLTTSAGQLFQANFNRPDASNLQVSAVYDSSNKSLTLAGTAQIQTSFMAIVGFPKLTINATSTAKLGPKRYPVCVLITNPNSNHTFLVKNGATVNFTNCLTQVNTQNWDAVEARDTAYIHSANGVNCFTGDIHYGDVQPPKQPTCDMLPDPFASYTVPVNSCTFTNKQVNATTTLSPGTYCGGIKITGSANVTFSPGLYYIQNGDLQILNSSNVTANGVTFLISGANSNINITTTGTITMSPDIDTSAGQWAGFQFYYDQPTSTKGGNSYISKATVTMSGVVYLAGQILNITQGAKVTVNPGAIVADFILPDGADLTLSSQLNSSNPALFSKSITGNVPVLVN